MTADIEGLLNAYRLATAEQLDVWSPIEQERREQAANDAARELADLLLASLREPVNA